MVGEKHFVVRLQGDVRSYEDLDRLVPEGAWIFHLASVVGVVEVLARPRECFETSVKGSEMICKIARVRGCRLLFTSSSEVYGNGIPMAEEDPLPASYGLWPRASYPEGKAIASAVGIISMAPGSMTLGAVTAARRSTAAESGV